MSDKPIKKKIIKIVKKKIKPPVNNLMDKDENNDYYDLENIKKQNVDNRSDVTNNIIKNEESIQNTDIKDKTSKIFIQQNNIWTNNDKEKLKQLIKDGKSIPEISSELNKTENSVKFQLKMTMYNSVEEGKIKEMTDLIDGFKSNLNKNFKIDYLYNDRKFLDMITVFNFLDNIKEKNPYYINLYEQVKKECMDKLDEITNKNS